MLLLWGFAACVAAQPGFRRRSQRAASRSSPEGDAHRESAPKVYVHGNDRPVHLLARNEDYRPCLRRFGKSQRPGKLRGKKTGFRLRECASSRLRLDVAVSGASEMYSWAGENRFQDRNLADLVGSGVTSTGTFASFLASIFGTDAASFTYNGDVNVDGRALVEFGFRVPLAKSRYTVTNQAYHAIVAYNGTFLVDPKTSDLVRLTIRVDQIPAELNACENTTILDYGKMRVRDSEFLLPREVRLHVTAADGGELENRTVFSVHEFLGESLLRFDAPSEAGQSASQATALKTLALPAGLPFTLALADAIDTATAASGDAFKARLTSAIRDKRDGVLVPKGAAITGRIVQIERIYGPASAALRLAIRLETVESGGTPQPFAARVHSSFDLRMQVATHFKLRQDLQEIPGSNVRSGGLQHRRPRIPGRDQRLRDHAGPGIHRQDNGATMTPGNRARAARILGRSSQPMKQPWARDRLVSQSNNTSAMLGGGPPSVSR